MLNHHLMVNNLQEPFPSAYRVNHSTETAMLRVKNDIIRALGDNKVVLLVLIDISAAFDTVNHERLLSTLHAIGITGKALAWFMPYLQHHSQTIAISGKQSRYQQLECGVHQRPVLGPPCSTYTLRPLASSFAKKRPTTQCTPTTVIST